MLLYLVCIKFHIDERHPLVHIAVMLQDPIKCFWDILHDQVEEKLIFACGWKETVLQRNHIRMIHGTHYLQFSIFIPSVLQHLFYCNSLSSFQTFCLKMKRPRIEIVVIIGSKINSYYNHSKKQKEDEDDKQLLYLKNNPEWPSPNDTLCHVTDGLKDSWWKEIFFISIISKSKYQKQYLKILTGDLDVPQIAND